MSEPTTAHATFTVERRYPAAPARAFAAWADPAAKARWFAGPHGWRSEGHQLDFRPGGTERVDTYPNAGGDVHAYRATYYDIVPDQRIVYAYEMYLGETRMSVSLATVLFEPSDGGTLLTFTEQMVMLGDAENWDARGREMGTQMLLENLGREVGAER